MNFVKGQVIYYVHALDVPFIAVYTVVKDKGDWIDVKNKNEIIHEMSKKDANIIPNKYNSHRVFEFFYQARNYMNSRKDWCPRITHRHVYIGTTASKYVGMVECTEEDFRDEADKLWKAKGYEYPTTNISNNFDLSDWSIIDD